MGLIRLLAYIFLFWIVWFLIKNYLSKKERSSKSRKVKPADKGQNIVKCRHCDLHLPEETAIRHNSEWFCSNEHKQAYLENS